MTRRRTNMTKEAEKLNIVFVCWSCRAQETFLQWDQCRRFYNFFLANNLKKLILSHR